VRVLPWRVLLQNITLLKWADVLWMMQWIFMAAKVFAWEKKIILRKVILNCQWALRLKARIFWHAPWLFSDKVLCVVIPMF